MAEHIEVFRYWSRRRPIPEGWELVSDFAGCHHGHHSVLLKKIEGSGIIAIPMVNKYADEKPAGEKK